MCIFPLLLLRHRRKEHAPTNLCTPFVLLGDTKDTCSCILYPTNRLKYNRLVVTVCLLRRDKRLMVAAKGLFLSFVTTATFDKQRGRQGGAKAHRDTYYPKSVIRSLMTVLDFNTICFSDKNVLSLYCGYVQGGFGRPVSVWTSPVSHGNCRHKRETTPVTVFPTWHVRATTCHVSLRMCRPVSAKRLEFHICLHNGS